MVIYHILLNALSCVIYGFAITQIYIFKDKEVSVMFVIGLLLISNIANIAFSMSFSTLFENSKLAAYSYFMIMLIQLVLYVTWVGKPLKVESDQISNWIYSMTWFPLFPTITLLLNYLPLDKNIC